MVGSRLSFGRFEVELFIGLALKGGGALASLAVNLLLARTVGAAGVGTFQIALTTASLFGVIAVLGLDNVVIRAVAVAWHREDWGEVNASIRRSLRVVGLLAVVMTAVMLAISFPLAVFVLGEPDVFAPLLVMAFAVPALALIRTISSAIRATGRILLSQSLDGIGYTGLTAIALAAAFIGGLEPAPPIPSIIYAVSAHVILVTGAFVVWRMIRAWPIGNHAISLRSGLRIATVYVLGFLVDWTAIIILGAWEGPAGSGIYRVAVQFGLLFMLVRNSFDQMVGSHLARAYAHGATDEMVSLAKRTSLLGALVGLPIITAIVAFPDWLMGLFGTEFRAGATALVILACAQFAGVVAGPVGTFLDMSHREHVAMRIEIAVAILAVALQFALIPRFGIEGAAIAVLAAILIRNVSLLLSVRHLIRTDMSKTREGSFRKTCSDDVLGR